MSYQSNTGGAEVDVVFPPAGDTPLMERQEFFINSDLSIYISATKYDGLCPTDGMPPLIRIGRTNRNSDDSEVVYTHRSVPDLYVAKLEVMDRERESLNLILKSYRKEVDDLTITISRLLNRSFWQKLRDLFR